MRTAALVLLLALAPLSACSPDDDRAVITQNIVISLEADGTLLWNGEGIDEAELNRRFQAVAAQEPQPSIHLVPSHRARYETVAGVLAAAQRAHIVHIGFTGIENDR